MMADCDKLVIENPVNIISGDYVLKWFPDIAIKYGFPIEPSQIIQPYFFGDHARKTTCLWINGLKKLKPTKIVEPGRIIDGYSVDAGLYYATNENGKILSWNDPETAKIRSKTFHGVARAMAEQWGGQINNESEGQSQNGIKSKRDTAP